MLKKQQQTNRDLIGFCSSILIEQMSRLIYVKMLDWWCLKTGMKPLVSVKLLTVNVSL